MLAGHLAEMMAAAGVPAGLAAIGYHPGDVEALAAGAIEQQRLLANAPREVGLDELRALYLASL